MFLNPSMVAGVGGAAVPLVLHLLSRGRYRDVEWGAMMFLSGADARQRQSARFSQIVLLLLRMAIVAGLAVALARPVIENRWSGVAGGGRVTAVVVLDCSGSMSFDENGRTRFDLAQRAAKQVLAGLSPGDRASLVTTGLGLNTPAQLEPTADQRSLAMRIDQLRPGYGTADMKQALTSAAEIFEKFEAANRDIYVICDRQASSWRALDTSFRDEWLARVKAGSERLTQGNRTPPRVHTRFFVVPVGSADADNVAVESLSIVNPPAIRGQPAEIEVKLRNYGPTPHADLPLTLRVGKRTLLQTKLALPASASQTLRFARDTSDHPIAFDAAGSQVLSAELTSTGYRADDRLNASVDVIEPISVLVLSGDERTGAFRSEGDFLRWALAPHQSAGKDPALDPCAVKVEQAETWVPSAQSLESFQVLVLANVERFNPAQAHAIEQYVYNGGRVLIAPGNLSRVEEYNATLYRDGAGILPAALEDATPADGAEATALLGYDTGHPIFQFLRGKTDPIPSATIGRYFPSTVRQTFARALAWYTSGDPFLIEGDSERGKVLLMTTSLDADWTTLPLTNFYLPFVQNAVRYLAADDAANRTLAIGDPIQLTFNDASPTRKMTIFPPGGLNHPLSLVRFGRQSQAFWSDTQMPGEYRLEVEEPGKPNRSIFYVLRPPYDESDLTQLAPERWDWLEKELNFRRIDPTEKPIREVVSTGREGYELWGPLLGAVLLLSVVEMLMSRIWSVARV